MNHFRSFSYTSFHLLYLSPYPALVCQLTIGSNVTTYIYKCFITGHTFYKRGIEPRMCPTYCLGCDSFSTARDHVHPVRLPSLLNKFSCPVKLLDSFICFSQFLRIFIYFLLKFSYRNCTQNFNLGF